MTAAPSPWLRRYVEVQEGATRLLCLPHAGGGASIYRAWARAAGARFDVVGIQPPGRGDRLGEAACQSVGEIVDGVAFALEREPDGPLVLFGHSLGGLVAFELAARLEHEHQLTPDLLVVACVATPDREVEMHRLSERSDSDLVAALSTLGALPEELMAIDGLLDLVLPPIRADLRALGRYRVTAGRRVSCPILALAGADDGNASPAALAQWSCFTTGQVTHRVFTGGHFFVAEHVSEILTMIDNLMRSRDRSCTGTRRQVDTVRA